MTPKTVVVVVVGIPAIYGWGGGQFQLVAIRFRAL